jgi:excisionase family DNA binding protein
MDHHLWGTKELADYLGVSERTALRRMRDGTVPAQRIGKLWRVSPELLGRVMDEHHTSHHTAPPAPPAPPAPFWPPENHD